MNDPAPAVFTKRFAGTIRIPGLQAAACVTPCAYSKELLVLIEMFAANVEPTAATRNAPAIAVTRRVRFCGERPPSNFKISIVISFSCQLTLGSHPWLRI
jgi:hypothetical protein